MLNATTLNAAQVQVVLACDSAEGAAMAFAKKTEQMAKSSLQMEAVGQQLASFSMQSAPRRFATLWHAGITAAIIRSGRAAPAGASPRVAHDRHACRAGGGAAAVAR